MNTRLLQFLQAENISQSQFADTIGVTRASISHILSGRNKPGYDFLYSISRHYPALNIEWLITGKGKMYGKRETRTVIPDSQGLFPEDDRTEYGTEHSQQEISQKPDTNKDEFRSKITSGPQSEGGKRAPSISKVIVFFDDGSYREIK